MSVVFIASAEFGGVSLREGGWTGVFGTVTAATDANRTGVYSYKVTGTTKNYLELTKNCKQIAFAMKSNAAVTEKVFEIYDGATLRAELEVYWTGDQTNIRITGGTGSGASVDGGVNGLLLKLTSSTTLELYSASGTLVSTKTITSTTNITKFRFGKTTAGSSNSQWFDDFVVSDSTSDTIANSRVIARQFKAGTPTYNAFTKVGGTNINDVCAETPYSATKYATGTDLIGEIVRQTGLLSAFSTGTDAIVTLDAIKGCKVGLIAKVSGFLDPPALYVSRIVNSVLTETDISADITTVDKYFESDLFTATLAQLDAMEAGGTIQSLAGDVFTIEDVWVLVAYIRANVYAVSRAETGAAVETPSATKTLAASQAESGSAVDTPSATKTQAASRAETLTAVETPSATKTLVASESETLAASETVSAQQDRVASQSESLSAVETLTAQQTRAASQAESLTATETESAVQERAASQSESLSAEDSSTAQQDTSVTVSESGTLSETQSAQQDRIADVSETLTSEETQSAQLDVVADQAEIVSAEETQNAGIIAVASQTEQLTATEEQSVQLETNAARSEVLNAQDSVDAEIVSVGDVITCGGQTSQEQYSRGKIKVRRFSSEYGTGRSIETKPVPQREITVHGQTTQDEQLTLGRIDVIPQRELVCNGMTAQLIGQTKAEAKNFEGEETELLTFLMMQD